MPDQPFEITAADVAELCRVNPLASEQLKNIVLRQELAELQRQIVQTKDSKEKPLDEKQDPRGDSLVGTTE